MMTTRDGTKTPGLNQRSDRSPARPTRLWPLLGLFIGIWIVRATFFGDVRSQAIKIVLWGGVAYALARLNAPETPWRTLKLWGRPSWKGMGAATGLLGIFLTAVVWDHATRLGKALPDLELQPGVAGIALWSLTTALTEEPLFRGVLLEVWGTRFGRLWGNLFQALLFGGMHLPYWLWVGRPLEVVAREALGVAVLGAVMGVATQLSRSLWPAVFAHALNNGLQAALR